jgi:RNA polymerase sigma factor (sigma-70 family)
VGATRGAIESGHRRRFSGAINNRQKVWINNCVAEIPDVGELEALYRSRYRHFLRVALVISPDEQRAHDAVQEGFAAAIRSRKSYRREGSLEAWVWRAVVNAAKKQWRERSPGPGESAELVSGNGDVVEERTVRAWISSLPERQRLAIYLRYYADLDYRSIATALEVEVGTVSATLSAAHRSLRKQLQGARR